MAIDRRGFARSESALAWLVVLGLAGLVVAFRPPSAAAGGLDEARLTRNLTLPAGFRINLFAEGLGRARLMVMTGIGDIILSSPGSKVLLVRRDGDGDGRSDGVSTLITGLNSPHGLWLDGDWLYIAEEGRILRAPYDAEGRRITARPGVVLDDLPDDGGHWTRTIKKGPDGYFYVTIGSSCNICRERHPWRAAMIRFRPGGRAEIYATGLRNTVGFDWRPENGALYGVENGRDMLGDDIPPDELNRIVPGGFYGWPFYHGGGIRDPDLGRMAPQPATGEARQIPPAHAFGAHVAPLSIRFVRHTRAANLKGAALVTQHGSWNRSSKVGYRVVALFWRGDGSIIQRPFLSGFLKSGGVSGRPVDVIEADDGTLYVSDDYAGAIWRITYRP